MLDAFNRLPGFSASFRAYVRVAETESELFISYLFIIRSFFFLKLCITIVSNQKLAFANKRVDFLSTSNYFQYIIINVINVPIHAFSGLGSGFIPASDIFIAG